MDLPASQAQSGGNESIELRFEDETEESLHGQDQFHGDSGGSAGEGGSPATSRGSGDGSLRDGLPPTKEDLPCPRCQSLNTKFCYYNNYSMNQPRYFCRNCQRYWTVGGTLRNVPVGGGSRKKTRSRSRNINNNDNTYITRTDPQHTQPTDHHHGHEHGLPGDLHHILMQYHQHHDLPHESPMESMPAPSLGFGPGGFNPHPASQMSFLQFLEQNQPEVYSQVMEISLSRHLEAADLQALCYETQAAAAAAAAATMAMHHGRGYYSPEEMEKAAVWAQYQQLQKLAMRQAWEEQQQQQSLQSKPLIPSQQSMQRQQSPALGFEDILSSQQQAAGGNMPPRKPGFWETALMHSRPVMGQRFASETNIPPSSETEDPGSAMANDGYSHGHDAYEDASNSSWGEMNAADMYYH